MTADSATTPSSAGVFQLTNAQLRDLLVGDPMNDDRPVPEWARIPVRPMAPRAGLTSDTWANGPLSVMREYREARLGSGIDEAGCMVIGRSLCWRVAHLAAGAVAHCLYFTRTQALLDLIGNDFLVDASEWLVSELPERTDLDDPELGDGEALTRLVLSLLAFFGSHLADQDWAVQCVIGDLYRRDAGLDAMMDPLDWEEFLFEAWESGDPRRVLEDLVPGLF